MTTPHLDDGVLGEELRDRFHASAPAFRDVDVVSIMSNGACRMRRRRAATGALAAFAVAALLVAMGAGGLLPRSGETTTTPANGGTAAVPTPTEPGSATLSPQERYAAWATWASCLRAAEVPGVTVIGPTAGSDDITYTDEKGRPLPGDYREISGEWGSATESCAEKVPQILPELESRWGDLTSGPARDEARSAAYRECLDNHGLSQPANREQLAAAEDQGCVWASYDPDLDGELQCRNGEEQSGTRTIWDTGPWQSPEQAGELWLARQTDREQFASVEVISHDDVSKELRVRATDGRTTGVIYLLVNALKGYKLHGMNVCQPKS